MPGLAAAFLPVTERIVYNNPLPMWVYDPETLRFLEVNTAATVRYGYSRDESLTLRITDMRPPKRFYGCWRTLDAGVPISRYRAGSATVPKTARPVDADIVSHTVEFAGRRAAWVVVQDITERKRAEVALRRASGEAERRVRQLDALRDRSGDPQQPRPAHHAQHLPR